jgi:hypothetical protein
VASGTRGERIREVEMRSRTRWLSLSLLVFLIDSHPAFGEDSKASVSATYTVLRDTEWDYTFDRGISLGGALRVRRWVYVAAEVAFSDHREDFSSSQGGTYDFRYQSIQAGPRASPLTGRVQPYAELLAGITRLGIWERRLDRTGQWGSPDFSVQPGLGVDVFIARRVALRLAGDLRLLFKHDNRFDRTYRTRLYRVNAGLAVHLG